jgi:hypothetical protein
MADICVICKTRTDTNHLVLNGGDLWIEFCEPCGKTEILTNQNGEKYTLQEIFYKKDKD